MSTWLERVHRGLERWVGRRRGWHAAVLAWPGVVETPRARVRLRNVQITRDD